MITDFEDIQEVFLKMCVSFSVSKCTIIESFTV